MLADRRVAAIVPGRTIGRAALLVASSREPVHTRNFKFDATFALKKPIVEANDARTDPVSKGRSVPDQPPPSQPLPPPPPITFRGWQWPAAITHFGCPICKHPHKPPGRWVSVSRRHSHVSVGECGESIVTKGTVGRVFDPPANGKNGTVQTGHSTPFFSFTTGAPAPHPRVSAKCKRVSEVMHANQRDRQSSRLGDFGTSSLGLHTALGRCQRRASVGGYAQGVLLLQKARVAAVDRPGTLAPHATTDMHHR